MEERKIKILRTYEIAQVQLAEIMPPLTANTPFLLSIDAEGHDLNILKSNDWDVKRPRVVVTETLTTQDRLETFEYLQEKNYVRIGYSVLSSFFVAKEYLSQTSEINHFIS
jgi:hypothetical protein